MDERVKHVKITVKHISSSGIKKIKSKYIPARPTTSSRGLAGLVLVTNTGIHLPAAVSSAAGCLAILSPIATH